MSVGLNNCRFGPKGLSFECYTCKHKGGPYANETITKRMASNHIVKKHPDIAKPASQQGIEEFCVGKAKRPYTPRKPKAASLGVNFCPGCGCNLNAVRVALSL